MLHFIYPATLLVILSASEKKSKNEVILYFAGSNECSLMDSFSKIKQYIFSVP